MSVMGKGRLEAFSDGVIAIIITIMVLEMKVPQGESVAVLRPLLPVFLSYVLSFLYVGSTGTITTTCCMPRRVSRGRFYGRICTCCSGCPFSRLPRAGWARITLRFRLLHFTASFC